MSGTTTLFGNENEEELDNLVRCPPPYALPVAMASLPGTVPSVTCL